MNLKQTIPTQTALLFIMAVLAVCLKGVTVQALTPQQLDERQQVLDAIEEAASKTVQSKDSVWQIKAEKTQDLAMLEEREKVLGGVMKQKRDVRLALAEARDRAALFQERYGVDPTDEAAVQVFLDEQETVAKELVRRYARFRMLSILSDKKAGGSFLPQLFGHRFNEQLLQQSMLRAMTMLRATVFARLDDIRALPSQVAVLEEQHEELLGQVHASLDTVDEVVQEVQLSDAKLEEIRRINAAVDQEVSRMQSQLQQYDEKIRLKIEKELVAMGLRAPREGGYKKPTFIWPVVGRITAGYYEKSYQAYFGVPHKALDIATSQGTAIPASAHGYVHKVQHGGQWGYSYVLIGHRGGYATLYGHLSAIYVKQGDYVEQGQQIGLSGGMPGTVGAGPMTTGPHLHFEVIKEGAHVNPTSILP